MSKITVYDCSLALVQMRQANVKLSIDLKLIQGYGLVHSLDEITKEQIFDK